MTGLVAGLAVACATDTPTPDKGDAPVDDTDVLGPPPCLQPTLAAPLTAPDADAIGLALVKTGAARNLATRPVVIDGDGDGAVNLTTEGPIEVYDPDGSLLTLPLALTADDLPRTVLLAAADHGPGAVLVDAPPDTTCTAVRLDTTSQAPTEVAVRSLGHAPWLLPVVSVQVGAPLEIAVDPNALPDRLGLTADVYVVRHKAPRLWREDPTLVDVTEAVESITLAPGSVRDHLLTVWETPAVLDVWSTDLDVVLDFGRDGRLDPGDVHTGLRQPDRGSVAVIPDLTAPGPWPVASGRIDDGGWLQQEVFYPEDPSAPPGPLPLVVISHGNGHDYRWYDHIGEHLASWGFVVMSHANNTGPGPEAASTTTLDNTSHFLVNHGSWFNGVLNGHVRTTGIAWIGHSRGGEGVARATDRLFRGLSRPGLTIDDLAVVSSIAPTVFLGVRSANPHSVPYHLLVGGADGDVTGAPNCDVCMSQRIAFASAGWLSVSNLHGASHKSFHNGGGWDDTNGPNPLPRSDVHTVEKALYLALVGLHQRGVRGYAPWLWASWTLSPPSGVPEAATLAQLGRHDLFADDVLVVDRFQTETDVAVNDLGGVVDATVTDLVESLLDDRNGQLEFIDADPMNGATQVHQDGIDRAAVFSWDGVDAAYTARLPAGSRDLRAFDVLVLTAAQGTRHPLTTAHDGPISVGVELRDGQDHSVTVDLSDLAETTVPYPRTGLGRGAGWSNEPCTLTIPLRTFTWAAAEAAEASGLDLSDVRAVTVHVGPTWGAATGRLVVDDLYFAPYP